MRHCYRADPGFLPELPLDMLVQLAVQTHQHLLLPFLHADREGVGKLLRNGALEPLRIAVEGSCPPNQAEGLLMEALSDLLPDQLELTTPLGRELAERSPSVPHPSGPVLARTAIAGFITSLTCSETSLARILNKDEAISRFPHKEERFEILGKAWILANLLEVPWEDPLVAYRWRWTFGGRHQSARARGILNILHDLNPWRGPLQWAAALPAEHPLAAIAQRGAPTLLARHYALVGHPPAGLEVCLAALGELWEREMPEGTAALASAGAAFCLLAGALRVPEVMKAQILGTDFRPRLQSLLGEQAVAMASQQLGTTSRVAGR